MFNINGQILTLYTLLINNYIITTKIYFFAFFYKSYARNNYLNSKLKYYFCSLDNSEK